MTPGLRAAREAAGLSQAEAAAVIGRTQSTYSKIERGEVRLPVLDLGKLCQAFGVTVSQILT